MADSPGREAVTRAQELLDAATPGPWRLVEDGGTVGPDSLDEWEEYCVDLGDGTPNLVVGDTEGTRSTAEFIAAAPTLVADLLALTAADRSEIEALRAIADLARGAVDSFYAVPGHALMSVSNAMNDLRGALARVSPLAAPEAPTPGASE